MDLHQPDKKPARPVQTFSRWARGGMHTSEQAAGGLNGVTRRGLSRASQPHSAQAIVEFMLVSIPLLALIFGIMEFSLAWFESTTLEFATRNVARSVQICADQCDTLPDGLITNTNTVTTTVFRDYYALKTLQDSTLSLDNIQYVLIQHVGEQQDVPTVGQYDNGRHGPDTYADYQVHYQLYSPPHPDRGAGNAAVLNRNDASKLYMNDARVDQVGLSGILPTNANTAKYNGWRSNACPFGDNTCRQDTNSAKEDGSAGTNADYSWPGRYTCVPTDRFYVQIAYKHYWITPFMPSLDTTSKKPTLQGFNNGNEALVLSSKVYQKVEPTLYATGGSTCLKGHD